MIALLRVPAQDTTGNLSLPMTIAKHATAKPTNGLSFGQERHVCHVTWPTTNNGQKQQLQQTTPNSKFAKPTQVQTFGSYGGAAKKPTSKKLSLDDEDSMNFVKILSPAATKKRPLTDHQKYLMTSRRDDIPALYSELSRDDSSQMGSVQLPAQFQSQVSTSSSQGEDDDLPDIATTTVAPITDSYSSNTKNTEDDTANGALSSASLIDPKAMQKNVEGMYI